MGNEKSQSQSNEKSQSQSNEKSQSQSNDKSQSQSNEKSQSQSNDKSNSQYNGSPSFQSLLDKLYGGSSKKHNAPPPIILLRHIQAVEKNSDFSKVSTKQMLTRLLDDLLSSQSESVQFESSQSESSQSESAQSESAQSESSQSESSQSESSQSESNNLYSRIQNNLFSHTPRALEKALIDSSPVLSADAPHRSVVRSRLSGVLRCWNQDVLRPAVMKIRSIIYPMFPYKDVKGSWNISIQLEKVQDEENYDDEEEDGHQDHLLSFDTILIHHTRCEQTHTNEFGKSFRFRWQCTFVFDRLMTALQNVRLTVLDLEFEHDLFDEGVVVEKEEELMEYRERVYNLIRPLIDADRQLENEIKQMMRESL